MEMTKRVLAVLTVAMFIVNCAGFTADVSVSTLAPQPGTESEATRSSVAGTATEAIGEGRPLAAVLAGEMPAKVDTSILPAATINKVYVAIDLAVAKLGAHRFAQDDLESMKDTAISRLKELRRNLTGDLASAYFFHAIFENDHNFLYAFNRSAWAQRPDIGLSVEYVNFLSIEALAEVLAHEMAPKTGLIARLKGYKPGQELTEELARQLHKITYSEFQAPVFWAEYKGAKVNLVKEETNAFTAKMAKDRVKVTFVNEDMTEVINNRPLMRLRRILEKLLPGPVPQITEAVVAHNAGMNVLDLVAHRLTADGSIEEIHLFDTKPIEELAALFSKVPAGPYMLVGCIVDWCNRTGKGKLLPGAEVEVKLPSGEVVKYPAMEFTLPNGTKVIMAANNNQSALHGDYHFRQQDFVGLLPANESGIGTFGELEIKDRSMATPLQPWESPYRMHVETHLGADNSMWMLAEKENTGTTTGVHGRQTFHGYITPGQTNSRATTRLSMQATSRAEIVAATEEENRAHPEWGGVNYATCEATGNLVPIKGTRFDVSQPGGLELGTPEKTIDDLFKGVAQGPNGEVAEEIIYPEAGYKVRVTSWSRLVNPDTGEVKILESGIQNYVPAGRNVVCVEPAPGNNFFFGKKPDGTPLWGNPENDMVNVPPGWKYQFMWKLQVLPIDANELPKVQTAAEELAAKQIAGAQGEYAEMLLEEMIGRQTAVKDSIEYTTDTIQAASTGIVEPVLAQADKTNVAVVVQKNLLKALAKKDADLERKYQAQLQEMRKKFGEDSVKMIDSDRPEDFASELNSLMDKGYSVVGIADSSLAANLSGKVRGSIDRFRVAGIDLARPEELKDGFQYVNFNYIVLMELAAMSGNMELFAKAYQVVTGQPPRPGQMSLWFLRILPRIVKVTGDIDRQQAIAKLFAVSA